MSMMLFATCGNITYTRVAALLAIVLLIPGVAIAQERQIAEIKIVGNERILNEAILAAVALKPGMAFSEQAVQEAKQAIESMGYFQPGVTVGTESVESGVRLVFNLAENPVVKEVKITGNTVVETEKLLSLMRTSVGNVLNTNTLLQQDVRAIENYYEDQGYAAYVTEEIGIDPETGALNIPITEIRIEAMRITGNKKTKDYVILREMQQKPGDVYNVKALFNDVQRVYDLGMFELEGAVPYKTETGSDLGKVAITIPVKERKTGEVSVGFGYSSRQRLVGQARLSETNFRGRGQTVNLLWEQSGTRGSSYEAGFFEPWLDSKHTSLGVNLYNKLIFRFSSGVFGTSGSTVNDYDERRKGGSTTISRPFGRANRGFLTLRSESVTTNIENADLALGIISQDATVTSGTTRFTNDTRDSQLDPFGGSYNSYAVELGKARFEGDSSTFSKYSLDFRRYFSKGGPRRELNEKRQRLAVRLMGGSLSGTVPFFEQYFIGGAETLRGFREDRFWGRNLFLASAEYRFPVAQSLTGVVFADYGDAWGAPEQFQKKPVPDTNPDGTIMKDAGGNVIYKRDTLGNLIMTDLIDDFPQHTGFSPNLGYGIGIRVQTPLGPLRLDYGFSSEGSRAHFSIGHAF